MASIRSGWVPQPRIVIVLQPFTFQLCRVAISWLSELTHTDGGTLNLLTTDVPDLVRVAVVAPTGNSDHSSLSAVISMVQAVKNLSVNRKVFLKPQVNWNTVCRAIQDLQLRNICSTDNPFEVLNEHLSLLVGRYVPTKVIRVRKK